MNVEKKIERLRSDVRAALDEFEFVIRLYETWRPAAFDQDLFERMGPSYASHAFLLIREALAREIVLGLTKLWDSGSRPISMERIAQTIRTPAPPSLDQHLSTTLTNVISPSATCDAQR